MPTYYRRLRLAVLPRSRTSGTAQAGAGVLPKWAGLVARMGKWRLGHTESRSLLHVLLLRPENT